MQDLTSVIVAVIPIFLAVGLGLVVRRLGWLTAEADASLLRVTINLLVPCLVLDSVLGNPAAAAAGNLGWAPLVGFGTVALGLGVARLLVPWLPEPSPASRRTFALSTALYNYGYLPIPLALNLFDRDTVAVLFVHNLGVELALWSLGVMVLTGANPRRDWRRLFSPPLVAIAVAVVLNLRPGGPPVPGPLRQAAHLLGQSAIPLGLLLIGATLADHLTEFHPAHGWKSMVLACGLRVGVLPVLFLTVAWLLPLSRELTRVVVLQAAMPAAVFPIVMARHYGGDAGMAVRVVVATTVVSLVTTPVWIQLGMRWLDR